MIRICPAPTLDQNPDVGTGISPSDEISVNQNMGFIQYSDAFWRPKIRWRSFFYKYKLVLRGAILLIFVQVLCGLSLCGISIFSTEWLKPILLRVSLKNPEDKWVPTNPFCFNFKAVREFSLQRGSKFVHRGPAGVVIPWHNVGNQLLVRTLAPVRDHHCRRNGANFLQCRFHLSENHGVASDLHLDDRKLIDR